MSILDSFAQTLGLQISRQRFENAKLSSPEIESIISQGRNLTSEIVAEIRAKAEAVEEQKGLVQEYCKYGRKAYLGRAEIDAKLIKSFLPIEAEANAIRAGAIVEAEKKRQSLLEVAQSDQKYLRGVM